MKKYLSYSATLQKWLDEIGRENQAPPKVTLPQSGKECGRKFSPCDDANRVNGVTQTVKAYYTDSQLSRSSRWYVYCIQWLHESLPSPTPNSTPITRKLVQLALLVIKIGGVKKEIFGRFSVLRSKMSAARASFTILFHLLYSSLNAKVNCIKQYIVKFDWLRKTIQAPAEAACKNHF